MGESFFISSFGRLGNLSPSSDYQVPTPSCSFSRIQNFKTDKMAEVKSDKKGIHLIDKSLEEIIRVKGIENPYSRKRKKQSPPNRKSPKKNPYSQKRLKTEDLRNRIGTKCSVMISGLAKGVTRGDLEELFRPFAKGGNLSVKLHFNSNGFFNGSAEVDLPTRE